MKVSTIAKSYWFYLVMVLIGGGLASAGLLLKNNWLWSIGFVWLAVWGYIYLTLKRAE